MTACLLLPTARVKNCCNRRERGRSASSLLMRRFSRLPALVVRCESGAAPGVFSPCKRWIAKCPFKEMPFHRWTPPRQPFARAKREQFIVEVRWSKVLVKHLAPQPTVSLDQLLMAPHGDRSTISTESPVPFSGLVDRSPLLMDHEMRNRSTSSSSNQVM